MTRRSARAAVAVDESTRIVELVAVVLLGVATVASAWCAYQSSRWNGVEAAESRTATDERVEQGRLFSLGTQLGTYDTNVLIAYTSALAEGRTELGEFIRSALMRDEFVPVLDRWQAQIDAGSEELTALLDDASYIDQLFADATAAQERVVAASDRAVAAGGHADDYVMTTLFMAAALFFAGVVSSMRTWYPKVLLLAGSMLTLVIGASRIVDLPVA